MNEPKPAGVFEYEAFGCNQLSQQSYVLYKYEIMAAQMERSAAQSRSSGSSCCLTALVKRWNRKRNMNMNQEYESCGEVHSYGTQLCGRAMAALLQRGSDGCK